MDLHVTDDWRIGSLVIAVSTLLVVLTVGHVMSGDSPLALRLASLGAALTALVLGLVVLFSTVEPHE